MQIKYSKKFLKACNKLHQNQKNELKGIINKLIDNPYLGKNKVGILDYIRVYKFSLVNNLTLLAYSYHEEQIILELIKLGPRQNFYKDLENELKRSDN